MKPKVVKKTDSTKKQLLYVGQKKVQGKNSQPYTSPYMHLIKPTQKRLFNIPYFLLPSFVLYEEAFVLEIT